MFEICETIGGVSMKGLMEIKEFSTLINIRLIGENLMIK
jgi:hypothetical protein